MKAKGFRLVLVALALSLAACSSGGSAQSGSSPTTSPNQPRPAELIAMLRKGVSPKAASDIATGPVVRMSGVTGTDWSYSRPTEVFVYLAATASISELDAVRHKLLGTAGVTSVEVKLGS